MADTDRTPWRVGNHYSIHVYEGDRPVATFHRAEDAEAVVRLRAERDDLKAKLTNAGRALNIMQGHEIRADIAEAERDALAAQVERVRGCALIARNAHLIDDDAWPELLAALSEQETDRG